MGECFWRGEERWLWFGCMLKVVLTFFSFLIPFSVLLKVGFMTLTLVNYVI